MSYRTTPFLSKIFVDWGKFLEESFPGVGKSRLYQTNKPIINMTNPISPKNINLANRFNKNILLLLLSNLLLRLCPIIL